MNRESIIQKNEQSLMMVFVWRFPGICYLEVLTYQLEVLRCPPKQRGVVAFLDMAQFFLTHLWSEDASVEFVDGWLVLPQTGPDDHTNGRKASQVEIWYEK
jgi:hypothetical protein